jgi:hypothetical protein
MATGIDEDAGMRKASAEMRKGAWTSGRTIVRNQALHL